MAEYRCVNITQKLTSVEIIVFTYVYAYISLYWTIIIVKMIISKPKINDEKHASESLSILDSEIYTTPNS